MPDSADSPVPNELIVRLFGRKLVPLLGAGCSATLPSDLPPAGKLAEQLVDQGAGTDGDALEDIAEAAWERGGWREFAQLLPIAEWRARPPNVIVRVLAEFAKEGLIGIVLTTNWDLLIETAFTEIGQPYSKVVDADSLAIEQTAEVTLVKLNGCINHGQFIKARRTDIESTEWLDTWADALFDIVVRTNSMLFAGYSGAARAATATIARLVGAGERHAGDFIVDRSTPEQIASASPSGEQFIDAVDLVAAFTGDAGAFFEALRVAVYPRLFAQPKRLGKEMADQLAGPTALQQGELDSAVTAIATSFKAWGPEAGQDWLCKTFGTFPDVVHAQPYLPVLPNRSDVAKCLLLLAVIDWVGRLERTAPIGKLAVKAEAFSTQTRLPFVLAGADAQHRRDAAARAAVSGFDRSNPAPAAAVGVAFGGIGRADDVMTDFSIARGAQVGDAARGGGPVIAWIDGDALLAAFATDADSEAIQSAVRESIDSAAERALRPAA